MIIFLVWLVPAVFIMWALDEYPLRPRLMCGLFWFVWLIMAIVLLIVDVCSDYQDKEEDQ